MFKKQSMLEPATVRIVNGRFSLGVPPDWHDQSIYRYEGPDQDGVKHHINVVIDADVKSGDLLQYAELQLQALHTELRSFTLLKRGEMLLANGLPAYEFVYRWIPVQDKELIQQIYLVLADGRGYILTASFSPLTWSTLGPQVEQVLRSFTPL